ncbi:MAG: hypothetical protein NT099_04195 [Candidatus Saganbacteria bacterium]|nr:hypothetical protein [Candidatus Saganbacteria bacterium]
MKVAEFDQAFMIQVVDPANFVAPERTHPEAGPFDFRKERIRRATSLLPQGEKPSFPLELLGNVRRVSVGRQLWEVVFGLKRDPLHICGRIGGTNEAGFIHSTSVFQAEGLLDAVAMFYGIDLTTLPDTVAEKVLKTRETRMALLESRAYGAFFGKQGHYTYLDIIAAELNIGGPMKIDPSRQGVVYCGIAAGRVIDTV